MRFMIHNTSMQPIYEQLMDQIKTGIVEGTLRENDALPSVRALAKELRISALTVKKAYDALEAEGFVVTVHGKGSYIAGTDRGLVQEARRREVEELLESAIQKGKACGMTEEELREMWELMLE